MKKTYNAPCITVTGVETMIMQASLTLNDEEAKDLGIARGRRYDIQWIEEDEEEEL